MKWSASVNALGCALLLVGLLLALWSTRQLGRVWRDREYATPEDHTPEGRDRRRRLDASDRYFRWGIALSAGGTALQAGSGFLP